MQKPDLDAKLFAQIADHTLLASDATKADVENFLSEAVKIGVKRVCISPSLLPVNKQGLEIVAVIGFPSGAHKTKIKVAEAQQALQDGADEIDMVVNAALVHSGDWHGLEKEILAVREVTKPKILKVILETANLSDEQIVGACLAAERAEADFVKTSTGFHPAGGATTEAIKIMVDVVGDRLGVKASGGIRSATKAVEYFKLGATRFGVSATAQILSELQNTENY